MWLAARAHVSTPVSIAAGRFVITCASFAALLLYQERAGGDAAMRAADRRGDTRHDRALGSISRR